MKNEKDNIEIIETSAVEVTKKPRSSKIKNVALFKRGGYSLAITALVLAALIVFNWLVSSLADRFHLEIDMTADKKNSISKENLEHIQAIDEEVEIIVCSPEGQYTEVMLSVLPEYYGLPIISYTEVEYLSQTITLLDKYPSYNDNITVRYIDPQSSEFNEITTKYLNKYDFFYGDMIITSTVDGNERTEVLTFDEIYGIEQDPTTYQYIISSNMLENALTTAIMGVTTQDTKSAAILTGHNGTDTTALSAYAQLLERNNYEITVISDKLITSLSSDFDIIVISAPTTDFIKDELDVISNFLDNDGKLGKGLVYFADATVPHLPTLSAWLKQWGIEVSEGMLFGTDGGDYMPGDPSTLACYPVADNEITESILKTYAISESNVPMKVIDASSYKRKATALIQTLDKTVIAPIGAAADWKDYTDKDKKSYDVVIQSKETDVDSNGNELSSYVMAFSSARILQSEWSSFAQLCNQDIVMLCTQQAAHVEDIELFIAEKIITDVFFTDQITEKDAKTINTLFIIVLPLVVIAVGIVIFVRRRNAR
ncbi:MAG: GldG family protein [Clostridia bacterium]|nr:GldG family protein [Clostridia bacterium]